MLYVSKARACLLALLATQFLSYASATNQATSRSVAITSSTTPEKQWKNAPTQVVSASSADHAYRELGQEKNEAPLILLVHLAAELDNWAPRVVDSLAAKHHVIAFDNRGEAHRRAQLPTRLNTWPMTLLHLSRPRGSIK